MPFRGIDYIDDFYVFNCVTTKKRISSFVNATNEEEHSFYAKKLKDYFKVVDEMDKCWWLFPLSM